MEWYLKVVRDNFANFKGRARRKEYWMFILFNFLISIVIMVLDNILGFKFESQTIPGMEYMNYMQTGYLGYIYALALFIPSLAVSVRRLHDTGKSGWNLLWYFTCIGILYILYLLISEGENGANEYGADPKGNDNEDIFGKENTHDDPFANGNNPFAKDQNNPFN